VRESTVLLYREVLRAFQKSGRRGRFLRELCEHFVEVWSPALVSNRAYEPIYRRDRYRCSNPVCRRHDITPHHLLFRSQGGTDAEDNLTSLCAWCHLEGVHGGRIEVRRVAGKVHWRIGRVAPTVVRDRDKVAA
jgi:hypothetical protein